MGAGQDAELFWGGLNLIEEKNPLAQHFSLLPKHGFCSPSLCAKFDALNGQIFRYDFKIAFFNGHHKTSFTSLQTFLATHYLTLLQSGILYPAVESKRIARNLATMLHGTAQVEPNNINVQEPHNALAFALISEATATQIPPWHKNLHSGFQMLQTIKEQMTALNPRHTIICSEVMSRIVESGWKSIKPRLQKRSEKHKCSVVLKIAPHR